MKPGMAAQAGVPPLRGADKAKATNSQGVASAGRRTFTLAPVFASPCGIALDEARTNGAKLPATALIDQFYAEVQAMGGNRWDTSSLLARLEKDR